MALVDPHIHLWNVHDNPRQQRPLIKLLGWNRGLLELVAKRVFPKDLIAFVGEKNHAVEDYLPPRYLDDARPTGVARFVHVQAGWKDKAPLDPVGETEWLEGLREAGASQLAGIVAYADLRLGAAVGPVLDAHLGTSPVVRGVRYMLAHHDDRMVHRWAPAPGLASDATWRRGFEQLVRRDLSFDAFVYHHQLPELAALARDVPEARVVLCHVGTPVGAAGAFHGIGATPKARERIVSEWRDGLEELAACDNVHCKLSGVTMPVIGFGYHERDRKPGVDELVTALTPMIQAPLEAFGVERCMFASNFPIDRVSVDLAPLFSAYESIATAVGVDEAGRRRLFHDNAEAFYRLDPA